MTALFIPVLNPIDVKDLHGFGHSTGKRPAKEELDTVNLWS